MHFVFIGRERDARRMRVACARRHRLDQRGLASLALSIVGIISKETTMRHILLAILLAFGIAGAALADDGMAGTRFRAHLVGGDLSGNPILTRATGEATLTLINN